MATTARSGPDWVYGPTADLPSSGAGNALGGAQLAGPSGFYHGTTLPDPRFLFNKEQAGGFKGVAPSLYADTLYTSINTTPPAAHGATIVAAAHTVVSGTAMTLAAPSFGAVANIPIVPIGATGNNYDGVAPATAVLALDFGFAMATLVSGSATVTVADTTQFVPGMPLVFAAIATTTTPWLATVVSITNATTMVMSSTAPFSAATGGARVGTGNIWQPNEGTFALPTAAMPYMGSGPGLMLDPRQAIARNLVVTSNNASGVAGAVVIAGWDVYGQPMTESITITPSGSLTTYGVKAWKYIASVTPGFSDPTFTISVGTGDTFGFATKATQIENTEIWWAAALNTATTGFVAGLAAGTASTSTTADVRGTMLVSNLGGTGIGTTVSNGSHSGTAFTGNVLKMSVRPTLPQVILATPITAASLFGNAQA